MRLSLVLVIHNSNGRLRNQKLYRLSITLIIFGLLSVIFYIVDLEELWHANRGLEILVVVIPKECLADTSPAKTYFWYDTDYRIYSVKTTDHNFTVGVIPKYTPLTSTEVDVAKTMSINLKGWWHLPMAKEGLAGLVTDKLFFSMTKTRLLLSWISLPGHSPEITTL